MSCSEDLKILLNYRRLKEIKRCNNFGVNKIEDVAQHSFYVALYSMYIASEFNVHAGERNLSYHPYDAENLIEGYDVELVVKKALCHDLEESFTSDIPWNIKHHNSEANEIINKVVSEKIDGLCQNNVNRQTEDILSLNKASKSGKEGKLVNMIDMLELAIYSSEEVVRGNRSMKPMLDKCLSIMESYDIYEELIEHSPTFKELVESLNGDVDQLDEMYNSLIDIS